MTHTTRDYARLRNAMSSIEDWALAYPIKIFPEPDMRLAHEALQARGLTLDAVSAAIIRSTIANVIARAKAALDESPPIPDHEIDW